MEDVNSFNIFLSIHKPQLLASGIPEHIWEALFFKLTNQIFDAGEAFSLMLVDYENDIRRAEDPLWTVIVSKQEGVKVNNPKEVYIIDHAWTFRMDSARMHLDQIPGLAERMARILGVDIEDESAREDIIDSVLQNLWRYSNMYSINANGVSVENQMPIWYIMDEVGSGIIHNDKPNFRVVPFIYLPEQVTYSILFPIADSKDGDQVTRNFVESANSEKERSALLLPWKYTSFINENFNHIKVESDYFLKGHIDEILPEESSVPDIDRNRPLKVFSQYDLVNQYLTDGSFEIVTDETEADILWYTKHFKNFKEFSELYPNKFINQFPYENVITIKDLLSVTCRRVVNKTIDGITMESYPKWLPTTYNLKSELINFVSYFQNREKKGLDNHWICKPWNLARGLDTHITNDIAYLMRLPETGPKIAQKYIENPVLFNRPEVGGKVKFDIRYVILLKKTEPIEAYIYKNFFLRFANKPFFLEKFDDYERHFTVMNYSEFNLKHITCAEFLQLWIKEYPSYEWNDIETNICNMLKDMFIGATMQQPPCGIGINNQSRALYAADIMLSWEDGKIQPKLLEVNWIPDCKRACNYYPDFFNDIFKLLFLDVIDKNVFRVV